MGRQFPGPRNLSAFSRVKLKYAEWGRWSQFVTVAVPVAALIGGGLAVVIHGGSSFVGTSSAERISIPLTPIRLVPATRIDGDGNQLAAELGQLDPAGGAAAVVRGAAPVRRGAADPVVRTARRGTKPTASRSAAGHGGMPAGTLGTWSGQIVLTKGLTENFVLSLTRPGAAGSPVAVGTFTNQTVGCDGNVFLGGVSGGSVIELNLATTADPLHACPASMEADVQLAQGGSALDYEIIGVDSVHATRQSPLAKGALYR
jgi:hypothetical protein